MTGSIVIEAGDGLQLQAGQGYDFIKLVKKKPHFYS
jgi:hypothetical protein